LIDNRAHGLTVSEVRGFGQQLGQLPGGLTDLVRPEDRKAMLLAKLRLDVVALDDDAEALVEAIAKHARTEMIGDGKIWVTTVDSVLRVRTGDEIVPRYHPAHPGGGRAMQHGAQGDTPHQPARPDRQVT
jgi:nitrogen regulatory protein P-II 1